MFQYSLLCPCYYPLSRHPSGCQKQHKQSFTSNYMTDKTRLKFVYFNLKTELMLQHQGSRFPPCLWTFLIYILVLLLVMQWSQESSAGITTNLCPVNLRIQGLILGRGKRYFFSPKRPGQIWGQLASYPIGTNNFLPEGSGVEARGRPHVSIWCRG